MTNRSGTPHAVWCRRGMTFRCSGRSLTTCSFLPRLDRDTSPEFGGREDGHLLHGLIPCVRSSSGGDSSKGGRALGGAKW